MTDKKETWEEMKEIYPDQWLIISDFQTNDVGIIIDGIVRSAGPDKSSLTPPKDGSRNFALRYTGTPSFSSGFRHFANNHSV